MSVKKIPLEALQKIRQLIKDSLVLPDSENHPELRTTLEKDEDIPEPDSLDALGDLFKFASPPEEAIPAPNTEGRWFISVTNPGALFNKLPGLNLKPDFRLITYLYRVPEGGMGITYAVPEALSTTAQLEEALVGTSRDRVPRPEGAPPSLMDVVEGDRSYPSFMIASLLYREFQEFGTLGKQCNWIHHRLISSIPTQVQWKWQGELPKDLSPKVLILPDGRAAVEFFSCRVTAPVSLVRHVDQYPINGYHAKYTSQTVATT
ncbi:MAG: hypothetical protein SFW36_20455 [Leptolyngbyaceae cyanobacterium bins.59]|nr:hypothetical protein [Leptolyngbyaceae cyanobacterium bins.59]